MHKFLLAAVCGVGLAIASGALYGRFSNRWGPPADLVSAARHLETMPRLIGDWELVEELSMSPGTIQMLACEGYVNRRYVNQRTGEEISLAIIVGPPGPIAVHTPEICYSSRAYELEGPREATKISDSASQADSFWKVTFESNNAAADRLSVYYAWNAGEGWAASRRPRFEFASQPKLFKLQIAGLIPPGEDGDPCQGFLADLLNSTWTTSADREA